MALKDILVVLDSEAPTAGPYAIGLAAAFGASLTAVAAVTEPVTPTPMFSALPEEIRRRVLEDAEASASLLLAAFEAAAKQRAVVPDIRVMRTRAGELTREAAKLARSFDLTVLNQGGSESPSLADLCEGVLFGSGRAVLIVPPHVTRYDPPETAIVGWDGSVTAARALADALPLLSSAVRVQVVAVGEANEPARSALLDIARHLERHGIRAQTKILISVGDVANTLLSHAADEEAGLLVMGGYGHSRTREMVLGGATRDILRSMTLPVLMSH